jgi:hypothetical protein
MVQKAQDLRKKIARYGGRLLLLTTPIRSRNRSKLANKTKIGTVATLAPFCCSSRAHEPLQPVSEYQGAGRVGYPLVQP